MERSPIDPEDFLAALVDDDVRATMRRLDELITANMPGRSCVLWQGVFWGGTEQSIIGYGEIVQPRPRGELVEWFAVGLARQSATYSIYVNAVDDGDYLGRRFADRLGKVKIGAASIGFRRLDDVHLDVLAELVARAHELTPPDQRA